MFGLRFLSSFIKEIGSDYESIAKFWINQKKYGVMNSVVAAVLRCLWDCRNEKMETFIPGFRVTGDGSMLFEGGRLADETYRVDGQMKLPNLGGSLVLCEAKENMQDDEAGKKTTC